MQKQLNQVLEFHKAFDRFYSKFPIIPPDVIQELRVRLFKEEVKEYQEETLDGEHANIQKIAKELADIAYILFGTIISYGLQDDFERIFDEVNRSNMSKLDANGQPLYREDGKVLKSELYTPADLSFIKLTK